MVSPQQSEKRGARVCVNFLPTFSNCCKVAANILSSCCSMALNSFPCRLGTCSYVCDESTNCHCHRVKTQLNSTDRVRVAQFSVRAAAGGWECPEASPDLPLPPLGVVKPLLCGRSGWLHSRGETKRLTRVVDPASRVQSPRASGPIVDGHSFTPFTGVASVSIVPTQGSAKFIDSHYRLDGRMLKAGRILGIKTENGQEPKITLCAASFSLL